MIESVDDLFARLKTKQNNQVINLILKDDNMEKLFHELMESGYEPSIGYQAGRLSYINLKVNKVLFMIKTQRLVPDSLDVECSVSCEAVY